MSPADDQQRPDDAPRLWTPTFWAAVVTFLNTALLERGMITAASLFFVAYAIGMLLVRLVAGVLGGMYLALAATGLVSVGLCWLVHGRSAASPGHRPS